MRARVFMVFTLAMALALPVEAQSFLDKLKKKARDAVEETIDKAADDPKKEDDNTAEATQKTKQETKPDTPISISGTKGGPAAKGRWLGQIRPRGKGGFMSTGGLDILLSQETAVLRYSGAAQRCLAELSRGESSFDVTFVTGQSICGTRATMTLQADGAVVFHWVDAPNTPKDQKIYEGTLVKTHKPWPLVWSADADKREAFDVVGFKLGMTYEEALSHLEAEHGDLKHHWRTIVDEGSTTIVQQVAQKDAKKVGFEVLGEQLSLLFEAQTPEQMKVDQDTDVLARRAEIERMKKERTEKLAEIRRERASRSRRASRRDADSEPRAEDSLPPIPDMPPLRRNGADAELLIIARSVVFPPKARPHEANLMEALVNKYGAPSHRVDQGTRRLVLWAYDKLGEKIANAKDGACDHISKNPGRIEGLVKYYGVKGITMPIPPTVSPRCGLSVKAELRYNDRDRGVIKLTLLVYDQQRLLGDEWYKIAQFSKAYLSSEKAKEAATKKVATPDL